MISQPKGTAGLTPVDFFQDTLTLLQTAHRERSGLALRRGAIRIDSAKFNDLPDDQQERLLQIYSSAMIACGNGTP